MDTELRSHLRVAKNIFIFRQLSVEMTSMAFDTQRTGKIEVIDSIRGNSNFQQVSFDVGWCCGGTQLDVGKYYLAFFPDTGEKFVGDSANIVELRGRHLARDFQQTWATIELLLKDSPDLAFEETWDFSGLRMWLRYRSHLRHHRHRHRQSSAPSPLAETTLVFARIMWKGRAVPEQGALA